MPGIVGIISKLPLIDNARHIKKMVRLLVHEKTYSFGVHNCEKLGVWAGCVAHAGSFSDVIPIANEVGDVTLLFSGEHYGAERNARMLLSAYEQKGISFLKDLNGTFSGLLIDQRMERVYLFNDRFGLGRVYFHETEDAFYFASEAKALLAALPQLRELDPQGLAELFGCGCVLQNRTLFRGISILPPASVFCFEKGRCKAKTLYFEKSVWESQTALPAEEYYKNLREVFSKVVGRYVRPAERIAVSLTGGLDSRMVLAWMKFDPHFAQAYTHRGIYRECADARIGRRAAKACGLNHSLVHVDRRFFSEFRKLAERTVYITDGVMDVSGSAGLFANSIARREIAPVRMTGNYGGEILRGLIDVNPVKFRNPFFSGDFEKFVNNAKAILAEEKKDIRLSFIAFKQVPWYHYSRYAMEQSQLSIRSPFLDNDLVQLAYRAPADLRANQSFAARLIQDGNPALVTFPTDRGPLGRPGALGRLREHFQEFTFKAEYAYDYGMPQKLVDLDRLLSPLGLERLFLGRHKYYHFRTWYRRELANDVKDILLNATALSRFYLDKKRIEKMALAHTSGRGNYTLELHALLTAELIHTQLLENTDLYAA